MKSWTKLLPFFMIDFIARQKLDVQLLGRKKVIKVYDNTYIEV